MAAYYNEIEPYAAQWLRNLIQEGLIADGEVDTRSIVDVRPSDLDGFDQCHFFAGLGGWSGALRLAGVADTEPLWTGSCPCQPFSLAGKQKGFDDERHLWPVWRELIRERRPAKVFGEQVAAASEWLGSVRSDLEAMDYAMGAIPCEAASAGADHLRDRYWFVGHHQSERRGEGRPEHAVRSGRPASSGDGSLEYPSSQRRGWRPADTKEPAGRSGAEVSGHVGLANADCKRREQWSQSHSKPHSGQPPSQRHNAERSVGTDFEWVVGIDGKARRVKSGIRLLAHGIPARVAKLRALGNAIDLRPAAAFIEASFDRGDARVTHPSIQRNIGEAT